MKRVYVYQNCFAQDRFSRKVKNDRKCYKKLSQTRFLVFFQDFTLWLLQSKKRKKLREVFFPKSFHLHKIPCLMSRCRKDESKKQLEQKFEALTGKVGIG